MMKSVVVAICLSILVSLCTSAPANTRMERQYWKGRFSRNLIPQGRFSRDEIPQYWKGRFSRRDEIPQYWKGRFSRDEIPLEDLAGNEEDDKREIADLMLSREVAQDWNQPLYDQFWKGRLMRLQGGHKRQFSREMKYGMRSSIAPQDAEEEERNVHRDEAEEKRQAEEEERGIKAAEEEQGRFMRQGRFKKNEENLDELTADADADEKAAQGRF